MIEKKMELLEEENDRLKKEIENLREACKVQEQTISKLWNAYVQYYGMLMFSQKRK